jgi:hypothetical protein
MKSRPPVPVACTMDRAPSAGRQIPLMTRSQSTPESDQQAGLSTIVAETGAGDIFTVNSKSKHPDPGRNATLIRLHLRTFKGSLRQTDT